MKRPIAVLIVACMYVVVGAGGFVAHFRELMSHQQGSVWIEVTELAAIVCGAFMLRGQNWARWLAFIWITFHVVIAALNGLREFALHSLICIAIAWILFRRPATQYFNGGRGNSAAT